ncbi:MAG: hypothetical protein FWE37_05840 [Spirochaetaceae bacterium]|nr:hypothetical protein [Spirochaetaceae bacterium]
MALVIKEVLQHSNKVARINPAVWKATYSVFKQDGEQYIKLDTFGSQHRKNPEEASQTIEMGEEVLEIFANALGKKLVDQ